MPPWWNCSGDIDICTDWTSNTTAFECSYNLSDTPNIVSINLINFSLIGELSFNVTNNGVNVYWPQYLQYLDLSLNQIFGDFDFNSFNMAANSIVEINLSINNLSTIYNLDSLIFSSYSLTTIMLGLYVDFIIK